MKKAILVLIVAGVPAFGAGRIQAPPATAGLQAYAARQALACGLKLGLPPSDIQDIAQEGIMIGLQGGTRREIYHAIRNYADKARADRKHTVSMGNRVPSGPGWENSGELEIAVERRRLLVRFHDTLKNMEQQAAFRELFLGEAPAAVAPHDHYARYRHRMSKKKVIADFGKYLRRVGILPAKARPRREIK